MKKVSVIIPVYNVEEYIEKALDSVCNQTLKDIEIICIDDCSTDNSVEIIKRYAQKDSRIKLLKTKFNQGQGVARNLGIEHVNAEYIMFLDPDDWFAENACELAYNQIKTYDNDVVNFNFYIYQEGNNILYLRNMSKNYDNISDKNNINLNNLENFIISGGSVWKHIYKKEFITKNKIKFGYEHCGEDNIFFLKTQLLANSISILNEPLYYYRKRANKTSSTDTDKYCFEEINAKKECYKFIKTLNLINKYNIGLIFCINSIVYILGANNKKIKHFEEKKTFYYEIQKLLKLIINENKINKNLKIKLKYRELNRIINSDFYLYYFIKFFDNLFSIYVEENRIKINLLGIHIKIRIKY